MDGWVTRRGVARTVVMAIPACQVEVEPGQEDIRAQAIGP